ncbi:hypothetical protein GDO86_005159 [Hymenochirus boettgeri]|uniref:Uncharacterized protein n=1 Tax=Hymenochirus boettgeri TaxID=247094 RepID=A0A8T2J8A7_9PIPI|nr:hypothetical protein GDO86_005159 [Hymenochirus boettgeri]
MEQITSLLELQDILKKTYLQKRTWSFLPPQTMLED